MTRAAEVVDSVVSGTIALLDDVELDVFRRLSVLGGPADLALVEAAVSDDTVPAKRVVRVLANLAARALIRLDRTATAELDQEHEREDRSGGCARQRPRDGVGEVEHVEKCGQQGESGDQQAAFDVETHQPQMPISDLPLQGTPEGDDHSRKSDK